VRTLQSAFVKHCFHYLLRFSLKPETREKSKQNVAAVFSFPIVYWKLYQ